MLEDLNDVFLLSALNCYHKSVSDAIISGATVGNDEGVAGTGIYGNRAKVHSDANRFIGGLKS
jgi:hypothetical protein